MHAACMQNIEQNRQCSFVRRDLPESASKMVGPQGTFRTAQPAQASKLIVQETAGLFSPCYIHIKNVLLYPFL